MPCTETKRNANRQNARKSTGPRTEQGKRRSSRNALKHGFRAAGRALAPFEDRKAYDAYTASIVASLRPATAMEQDLAQRIADLSWRLRRVPDAESALLTRDTLDDLSCRCAHERQREEEEEKQREDGQQEQQQERTHEQEATDQEKDDAEDDEAGIAPETPARLLADSMAVPQNSYLTLQRYEQSLDRARSRALKDLRQLQRDRRQHQDEAEEAPPLRNEPTERSGPATPAPSGAEGRGEEEAPAREAAALRNEPDPPSLSSVASVAEPQRTELPNEPTAAAAAATAEAPSRPPRAVAPSRLSTSELPNEPTATPKSQMPHQKSHPEPPRLHVLKRSDLRPIITPPPAPTGAVPTACFEPH